ncbi:uncharacterized protein [Argopecten irradians]|uniref:uncharacterized protein n=1 Tax=Argopecten irradians TaxID=31199 RepID=UPI003718F9CA
MMSDQGKGKPTLPFGWIVRQSTSFPDRVYYFNTQTGATTWEMPDLLKDLNPGLNPNIHGTSKRPSDVKHGHRKHDVKLKTSGVNQQRVKQQVSGESHPIPNVSHPNPAASQQLTSVNHPVPGGSQNFPIEAKFSPEFSDDDGDSLDLSLEPSDTFNPASEHQSYYNFKEHWTSDKFTRKDHIPLPTNEHLKTSDKLRHSVGNFEKKVQRAGSSAASVRSNSSNVENANRLDKGQRTSSHELEHSPAKKSKLSSNIHTQEPGSRYVLSSKDIVNSKYSHLGTLSNPPDILVGTEKCGLPSGQKDRYNGKVEQKRSIKSRLGYPQPAGNTVEDCRKIDKGQVWNSSKSSSTKQDSETVNRQVESSKTRVKKKAVSRLKVKSDETDGSVTKSVRGDVRKVISSDASHCSLSLADFQDAENAARDRFSSGSVHGSDTHGPTRRHLSDPEKLLSIQSWINHCEPEDDLSDKSSEIQVPCWNISSPDQDSGQGSLVPKNPDRRVIMSNDKLSISTVDSVLQPSVGESRKDFGVSKNNSWKGVHAKPAPVAHRNVTSMEIDEWQAEPAVIENRQIEGMDVSEIALKEVREHLQKQVPTEVTGTLTERVSVSDSQTSVTSLDNKQKLLVVVDTNVLIDSLGFVEELRDQEFKELSKPNLVIPWVVMQELDALKNSKNNFSLSTARKARGPVNFLFHCFKVNHPRVIGQTPDEAKRALKEFKPECNDDRILHCCLQCKKRNPESHVILLSNDKNLCTKAAILKIKACTRQSMIAGIEELLSKGSAEMQRTPSKKNRPISPIRSPTGTSGSSRSRKKSGESYSEPADQILCKAKLLIKNSLSIVLEREMKVAYNDLWLEIVFRKPPWTLEDILDCFKKHWIAVFGMIYNRKLKEEVHRLVEKFKPFKGFVPSLESCGEVLDDALKILEECEVHSNYGILFSEAFAELKLVQKFHRECLNGTVTGISLDTYLKRKTSSKSKKRLSLDSNEKTPQHRDSLTPPSMASCHTSPRVSDDGVVNLQPVEERFQTVWQTIHSLCATMKKWMESSAGDHHQEMNDILSKLVPFVKDLRFKFEHTLSFSPAQIKSQPAHVYDMCNKLNTFFSTMELEDEYGPVDIEQVQLYFGSEERRTLLKEGLRQLDDMIRDLFTFLHLLPD